MEERQLLASIQRIDAQIAQAAARLASVVDAPPPPPRPSASAPAAVPRARTTSQQPIALRQMPAKVSSAADALKAMQAANARPPRPQPVPRVPRNENSYLQAHLPHKHA